MAIENIVWIYALLFGVAALLGAALLVFAAQRVGKEKSEEKPENLPPTQKVPEDQGFQVSSSFSEKKDEH